jgi:hypothetical protein
MVVTQCEVWLLSRREAVNIYDCCSRRLRDMWMCIFLLQVGALGQQSVTL